MPILVEMDVHAALQSRLIGSVLVEKSLITGDQLDRALRLQEETGERLGEIVVGHFGVSRLELATVLAELWVSPDESETSGESLAQALSSRVEEIAGTAPRDVRAAMQERLDEIEAARVADAAALAARLAGIEASLAQRGSQPATTEAESPERGFVAFVPAPNGYRMLELPGAPPEIGSTVELDGCDGPLVVVRHGRSPLPLDDRACAYLDRA
jgi:hypothetical protein